MTKSSKTKTAIASPLPSQAGSSKLDQLAALLAKDGGASLADMMGATAWQAHSVRGALSGALKKGRGLNIVSQSIEGERRYSIAAADQ